MYFSIIIACITVVAASPFKFPTPDGFPNPSPAQLLAIQKGAGGFLPNSPLPTTLTSDAITFLQFLANNEFFEVALFTELLKNITNNVLGYDAKDIAPLDRDLVIKSISAIVNVCTPASELACYLTDTISQQEEVHAVAANAIL